MTRRMENDVCILKILDLLNNICYMMRGYEDTFVLGSHKKVDKLFDILNSYWHGRDGDVR